MGIISDKIKELITKWKKRQEKIDVILDSTLVSMQSLAGLVETLQDDAEDLHTILTTIQKRQEELGKKIQDIDNNYNNMKQKFWFKLFFGGD